MFNINPHAAVVLAVQQKVLHPDLKKMLYIVSLYHS